MLKAAVAGLVLSISGFANAGLIVKTIEIENALGQYLQVSEFVAWGTNSNSDLALTSAFATASGSDYYLGNQSCSSSTSDASCVLNGSGPTAWNNIYHGNSASSVLTITLATASEINWFEIFGRTDCCGNRDVYNVSLFDAQGTEVHTSSNLSANNRAHSTGRVDVPEPTTLAIFALGIMGLAARRFKKQ
jgi:hypothetical protein